MVTEGCVILVVCPPCLETDKLVYSLLRRHFSSIFRQLPPLTAQLNNLVAHPVGMDHLECFWIAESGLAALLGPHPR